MAFFKCKMCGGTIEFEQGATVGVCDSCGTKQTLPRLDDDRKANLYDRANHFRRNNEFDKAMGIYEQILNEDATDAEAYWSLVLCKYGIEYVEDPTTHRRVPTVNRAQYTSIFADEDYKSAIEHADGYQKDIYEAEAKTIDEIQKGILEISSKEEPFDVFICYKETDASGRRTPDSVLATELYHELTRDGFKVFFSRITLEDKLGQEYEPYIFAALNSAKVMVVLGTKAEHFNAVWVKNEWSRFLALIKNGERKVLIPAYKDMDPYDLPEEFSHLQAQDMSKLGFMQDLIRGIKKMVSADEQKPVVKETVINTGVANVAPLLKRAFMFLEDGEWDKADEFCEQVLNQDPENAEAYLGKLMAELKVHNQEQLADCAQPFDSSSNYQKAIRFGDSKLKTSLEGFVKHIVDRNENARLTEQYTAALNKLHTATDEKSYHIAASAFKTISGFKDADELYSQCVEKAETCRKDAIYDSSVSKMENNSIEGYESAIKGLKSISGWKDSDEQIALCQNRIEEIKAKEESDRLEAERQAEKEKIEREKKSKRNKKITVIVVICVLLITSLLFVISPSICSYLARVSLSKEDYYKAYSYLNKCSSKDMESIKQQLNDKLKAIYDEAVGKSKDKKLSIETVKELYSSFALLSQCNYQDSNEYAFAYMLIQKYLGASLDKKSFSKESLDKGLISARGHFVNAFLLGEWIKENSDITININEHGEVLIQSDSQINDDTRTKHDYNGTVITQKKNQINGSVKLYEENVGIEGQGISYYEYEELYKITFLDIDRIKIEHINGSSVVDGVYTLFYND